MATDSTNPTWIEPPPPSQSGGGCGRGCLALIILGLLIAVVLLVGGYFFLSKGAKPRSLPVEDLPPAQLSEVRQRVDDFKNSAPSVPSYTPPPASNTPVAASESPTPSAPTPAPGRQLVLSAAEINGLISANPKSRGHAFVTLSGNTADVQVSVPANKVPGIPKGYLNGGFVITTNGPTSISALQVSQIEANGMPVPSGILSASFGGRSVMGMTMEAIAPYNVSTVEISNGSVIFR